MDSATAPAGAMEVIDWNSTSRRPIRATRRPGLSPFVATGGMNRRERWLSGDAGGALAAPVRRHAGVVPLEDSAVMNTRLAEDLKLPPPPGQLARRR